MQWLQWIARLEGSSFQPDDLCLNKPDFCVSAHLQNRKPRPRNQQRAHACRTGACSKSIRGPLRDPDRGKCGGETASYPRVPRTPACKDNGKHFSTYFYYCCYSVVEPTFPFAVYLGRSAEQPVLRRRRGNEALAVKTVHALHARNTKNRSVSIITLKPNATPEAPENV